MKRIGNLYGQICSFENLYLASGRAGGASAIGRMWLSFITSWRGSF